MRKSLTFIFLCCCHILLFAQEYDHYSNVFNISRSSQTAFNKFVLVAPCPQTNEYQEVIAINYSSYGKWKLREIDENQNQYLELDLYDGQLRAVSQNFSVGYTFTLSPKTINIDFSPLKNDDGTWKEMPAYDTSSRDYKDNTKRSGNIVVPNNKEIQAISNQIFTECDNNLLAYAERCYEYFASHYKYLNPYTGMHPLSKILAAGGGDCGNLSSIYISLLRAKGIPARHVMAIRPNTDFHIWAEFYIQDFGWVPVDVTYKNGNPQGNYFGRYNYKDMAVVQKGVAMTYKTSGCGSKDVVHLQTFSYWFWYDVYATMEVSQKISAKKVALESSL
jgi:hypothetical protein